MVTPVLEYECEECGTFQKQGLRHVAGYASYVSCSQCGAKIYIHIGDMYEFNNTDIKPKEISKEKGI